MKTNYNEIWEKSFIFQQQHLLFFVGVCDVQMLRILLIKVKVMRISMTSTSPENLSWEHLHARFLNSQESFIRRK